ncbi:MAG: hypothetical protein PVI90_12525 [Desulfobacteraceae bacterium]|jgi:hypothetical protein
MIRITRTNDEIVAISFNGEDLQSDGGERWYLPKGLVGDEIVNHLPANIIFEICSHNENQKIGRGNIPIYIEKISENVVMVNFEDSTNRDTWEGVFDLKAYMETKKNIIKNRAEEAGDIFLDQYEDDGTWIHLFFSTQIRANTINLAIIQAEQMIAEIESAVEMHLEKKI